MQGPRSPDGVPSLQLVAEAGPMQEPSDTGWGVGTACWSFHLHSCSEPHSLHQSWASAHICVGHARVPSRHPLHLDCAAGCTGMCLPDSMPPEAACLLRRLSPALSAVQGGHCRWWLGLCLWCSRGGGGSTAPVAAAPHVPHTQHVASKHVPHWSPPAVQVFSQACCPTSVHMQQEETAVSVQHQS